ncbi:hypothetical protein NMY22_g1732 [Coprinellus aureogranulatus]|nr:hypothetical protein NMY22_g1732 [Coprinellus aureogranulatus]
MRFSTIAALVTTAILGASSVMANVDFEGDYTLATREFDDELELVERGRGGGFRGGRGRGRRGGFRPPSPPSDGGAEARDFDEVDELLPA